MNSHIVDLTSRHILFLFGPPGCGKNFLTKQLIKLGVNLEAFSAGELLRIFLKTGSEEAEKIRRYIAEGNLVPVEIVGGELFSTVQSSTAPLIIIDGFPRNMEQVRYLFDGEHVLVARDKIMGIHINKSLQTCIEQISSNGDRKDRIDDDIAILQKRYRDHFKDTFPAMNEMLKFGMPIYDTGRIDDLLPEIGEINDFFSLLERFPRELVSV